MKDIVEEGRYSVVGVLKDGVLDDGTGSIRVEAESAYLKDMLSRGGSVRVLGRGKITREGRVIVVSIVHPLTLPLELYNKVRRLVT